MSEYHQRIKKQGQFEFSFEPKSFWEYIRGGVLDKIIGDSKSYGETYTGKVPIHKGRHNEGGFLSKFNSEYAKRIIEMWSKEDIDYWIAVLQHISDEAYSDPGIVTTAPHNQAIHKLSPESLDDPDRWAMTWRAFKRKQAARIK